MRLSNAHPSRATLAALVAVLTAVGCNREQPAPPAAASSNRLAGVIARGDSLALPGEWTPPPGDALEHSIAGFATTLCAGVFITGLEPADAAANVGW
ncbi:MAG: hypothetical protein IT358_14740, partial [Gemmatimonadaceae bacterium]|nr:hypothetical protein [Gemmatimonadaceae bacterium]